MTDNLHAADTHSAFRLARRLRIIGVSALLIGIASACLVYWLGIRSRDLAEDAATVGYYKTSARQMGVLYGQMGVMTDDLLADLKQPKVQAMIIVAVAVLAAFVCFYFAGRFEDERAVDEAKGPGSDPHHRL
jgi:hypothetical protein